MRKRNCRIEIYFTPSELETLAQKVRKSGLSREQFCRCALNGTEVKEAPSADVLTLIREIRRVGYNIEQLLRVANARDLIDVPQLRKALEQNQEAERLIVDSYTTKVD